MQEKSMRGAVGRDLGAGLEAQAAAAAAVAAVAEEEEEEGAKC